jgi:nucleoside-diphosphate kinase
MTNHEAQRRNWTFYEAIIDLVFHICYSRPSKFNIMFQKKDTNNMERTLSIIKPDGVSRGLIGEVIKRLEKNSIKIVAMKMIHMTKKQAEGFYDVHRERPFFPSLTDFMVSGPVVVMVLEGENSITKYRDLMGATNYKEAAEGTIRKDFATDIEKNVVHGSDAPETAAFEIGYFFNRFEIVG